MSRVTVGCCLPEAAGGSQRLIVGQTTGFRPRLWLESASVLERLVDRADVETSQAKDAVRSRMHVQGIVIYAKYERGDAKNHEYDQRRDESPHREAGCHAECRKCRARLFLVLS